MAHDEKPKPLNLPPIDPDEFDSAARKFIMTKKPDGGWPKMPKLPSPKKTKEGHGR